MVFSIRLRTGFYETKPYALSVGKGVLDLVPKETGETLSLSDHQLLSVSLSKKKFVELEIQTSERLYLGVLCDQSDFEAVFTSLKENLRTKIHCESEYEGGR